MKQDRQQSFDPALQESPMHVRLAKHCDAQSLERMVDLAYRGGKSTVSWKNEDDLVKGSRISEQELQELISSSQSALLLAEQGEVLVGCIHIERANETEAHIGLLAVHPEHQNKGLGRFLLVSAEHYARDQFGCALAKMFVLSGRNELLAWYKTFGYRETGETAKFPGPESGLVPLKGAPYFVIIEKKLSAISTEANLQNFSPSQRVIADTRKA